MFCSGILGSTPYSIASAGISCIKPIAPLDETTVASKFDSAATMLFTNAAGTLCLRAAALIIAPASSSEHVSIAGEAGVLCKDFGNKEIAEARGCKLCTQRVIIRVNKANFIFLLGPNYQLLKDRSRGAQSTTSRNKLSGGHAAFRLYEKPRSNCAMYLL